ncbi:unnamed protein product [Boreogadus saida]
MMECRSGSCRHTVEVKGDSHTVAGAVQVRVYISGLQSTMDEEIEEGGPTSKTTLSGEHGRRSKAKSPEKQERADSPGPSCVSLKSDRSMYHPPDLKDGRPSREESFDAQSADRKKKPPNTSGEPAKLCVCARKHGNCAAALESVA